MRTFIIIVAACIPVALATATLANAAEVPTSTVSYADLNLGSDTGRHTLDMRIASAVRSVCGAGTSLAERREAARCRDTATADAQNQVHLATLRTARPIVASR